MGKNDAPMEVSAKKKVSRTIEIFKPKKIERRDPRFTEEGGKVSMLGFCKKYKFLEEKQKEEANELSKQIKNCKDAQEREKLIKKRQQLNQRITMQKKYKNEEIIKRGLVEENHKRIIEGKQPKFLSKQELKEEVDKQTYGDQLKKVEEKRIKRESGKLMKRAPQLRRGVKNEK
ncbi:rRNA biogenesis protein rrp36, putative [Entamoeba histolytica HM-3:IMSS]|uniref:rRNA biogenesis protein RRP36 n=6 Tax=Entamoeba histolytica TaxID=5759 RepID=C4LYD5_ENTH1|nr:hypothetical protein, conserved [Entamoeba histolytica HM-1:IMSS]EMD43912.1 rRNA biogenesis protein rrp36, putative [Entamoeba histolytica KU27]EMS17109.1 rRNA biogenesis protein rrp36, putative [Entamoeba histolytica HM-3:IMSS]ENY64254.1 rRNA biogenesis protein rrp36, putative [Entamoeba histolytica HM-1:IMSS-A]GAT93827.1 hypothetical protein conserved [Entamoeba histolytica]EAL48986.1 hypothetical protein, conserved [Entamoeba histolytica HM-1:IMSS]|eukprot:XP_654373.1 hypothetical protein, conserved [Entamoeba histolytica HM-1:IMSS]